jgi:lytic cellulose monooxygenase (C1-hydroxylating)
MTYIASCTGGCANFKGDSGPVWVSKYMFLVSLQDLDVLTERHHRDRPRCLSVYNVSPLMLRFNSPIDYPDRTAMPWGENILHQTPSYYKVTIPAGLMNGEYLLRHEVLPFPNVTV